MIPRKKVLLKDGHSLRDWVNFCDSYKHTHPRRPLQKWTREEVRKHSKLSDFWIILYGKVYDLSYFLPYHPGGIPILSNQGGKDVTTLFEKYHMWVNYQALLEPFLVGMVSSEV